MIMACIVFNTVLLMVTWYGNSKRDQNIIENINYSITGIFTLEIIIKILGMGRVYFK